MLSEDAGTEEVAEAPAPQIVKKIETKKPQAKATVPAKAPAKKEEPRKVAQPPTPVTSVEPIEAISFPVKPVRAEPGKNARVPREKVPVGPNQRQFDRTPHSGTGRGVDVGKKQGHLGWGTDMDEQRAVLEETIAPSTSPAPAAEGPAVATTEDVSPVPAPKDQEEDLETYMKRLEMSRPKIALPPPRKPGEGQDDSEWKNAVPLKRDEDHEEIRKKASERKAPVKAAVALNMFIADSKEGRDLLRRHDQEMRRQRMDIAARQQAEREARDKGITTVAAPARTSPTQRRQQPQAPKGRVVVDESNFPKLKGSKATPAAPAQPAPPQQVPEAPAAPVPAQ